ncbi:MAG: sulfatase-like hydrolase/transferase [Candidatus Didemnitutus sp.]|nr:sulfatase-like hydrolase/transferase [Candidatus Didemnitutus sp.]
MSLASRAPTPSPESPTTSLSSPLLCSRFGGVWLFLVLFVALGFALRCALLAKAWREVTVDASLLASFVWGLVFDIGAAAYASLPLIFVLACLPANWGQRRWQRGLSHAVGLVILFVLLFGTVSEWTFWDEFGVRFNFIAVDYLVYTTEVIANIRESYSLPLIISGVLGGAFVLGGIILATGWPTRWLTHAQSPASRRWRTAPIWFGGALLLGIILHERQLPSFANNHHRELAKNGLWSLFAAFQNNVLDYDQFYRTIPTEKAFSIMRHELVADGSILLAPTEFDTLRYIKNDGTELHPNVIQITVESLSADFLGTFNRASHLMPELEAIAKKSLVFENFYATGTRTDRGMEALTLSLPPTPGRSLIKRPHNEQLFTLGSVFRAKGYDTAFLYGGYGYFDNMNYFFGNNGYRVIDRNCVASDDITFANAWGACDEDLYRWTLREADASHAVGKPFHYFVMTTSNHRPFTYPAGRIDLPSKLAGRAGAVKYSDFAIGAFLRAAATKPWFQNTVFVIVADHCAASAGKTELPVQNYHIPLLIYSPGGHIAPGKITQLTSQMDYAPTLLGLLNWSYPSRFFGHDVRRTPAKATHALIGNYQKLGHLEDEHFVVLKPQRETSSYRVTLPAGTLMAAARNETAENEAIAYYKSASYAYKERTYRALTATEFAHYSRQGEALAAPRPHRIADSN